MNIPDARLLCDQCGPAPHQRRGMFRETASWWECRQCGRWRLEPEPVDCQAIYGKDSIRFSRQEVSVR